MKAREIARWLSAAALSASLSIGAAAPAQADGYYSINGYPADGQLSRQLVALGLPFGDYWLRPNGDWGVLGSFWPAGNIYANGSGSGGLLVGSGDRSGNGSWSYTPGMATGAGPVGGDGNGCYYTANWSNC